MLTGTIHHDGTIGPASGILEKAKAARIAGKSIFLVPRYQAEETNITEAEHCGIYGEQEFCNKEFKTDRIDIERESGIRVIEVNTIQEALEYYIKI